MSAKLNVYVAGSFIDKDAIHQFILSLRKLGYVTITYDWTRHKSVDDLPDKEAALQLRKEAKKDRAGIEAADVVIVYAPGRTGTAVEIGMSLALEKPIVVYGAVDFRRNLFLLDPSVESVKTASDLDLALRDYLQEKIGGADYSGR